MRNPQLTKQSQSHVKNNNIRLILNTIISHEPLSRADIVRFTHISKPTVSNLIDELLHRNIVSEIGVGLSQGGRKPILLKFNSAKGHFVAFEMGRVGYRIAVSDLKGTILKKGDGEFLSAMHFDERLATIKRCILNIVGELHIDPSSILKIICIAPGVYVERGKEMKWFPGNEKNEPYDIKSYFYNLFHREVVVDHSTKLSLMGENVSGKARGFQNVLYIDFAFGLGCSIMINGNIYFGPNNSAGEIGYFYSNLDEFKNTCIVPYDFGALEKNISGRALQTKGFEAVQRYKNTKLLEFAGGNMNKITARTVFKAAMLDDPIAYSILKESFGYFNMALSNIINMLTPEVVIFGGGFSNAGEFLLGLIENEIQDKVLIMPKLEISNLKNDASIIGGIHYLIIHTDYLTEL